MTPYYQHGGISIYHGDARLLAPLLPAVDAVITDPIWPNSAKVFPGIDAQALLEDTLQGFTSSVDFQQYAEPRAKRVVIHMGCDSDPRFLAAVPDCWPFIRVCDLDYARPTYKGKIVQGGDIAYVFGALPTDLGRKLLPGRYISTRSDKLFQRSTWIAKDKHFTRRKDIRIAHDADALPHPCPRRLQHVRWLVKWFGGSSVCDPFLGSGTTALACKSLGIACTAIEIEERYCEISAKRLEQEVLAFPVVDDCEVAC